MSSLFVDTLRNIYATKKILYTYIKTIADSQILIVVPDVQYFRFIYLFIYRPMYMRMSHV